ncbi:MAG: hypothetical protein HOM96_01255, partial [Rickettsiales bacterium]|nr:hypothetical protein [Rickettsiales bacterium]
MIPIRYLILYILIFPLLVSCGGSSSYPTTSSSNSGSGGSSPTITTLSITGYDSCQYYGLSVGSSATSCDNHGSSSADIALSDLRNGDGKTINADSTLSGSSSSGFAGANNVMQIAEARSLLNDLTLDDDGSNVTVAILGSGFNKPAGSLKSGGTTNNYGYLNADDNIEDYSITTTDGSGNIIIDSNSLLSSIGNDGYSIYNKNTLEAFSPSQNYTAGGTTGITYDDDNAVFRTSKAKAVTTGITTNAVSYIYDIVSTDTTVDSINSHITGLESYYTPKQGSFQSGTLDYAGLTADSTSTFCSDDDCARNYHSFLSEDWDTDFYEYQSSIFEYGHNDVANGTALASIIGISSDSNIAGAASDTVINAYKTQIYHRKLLDVSSGSYIAQESGNYMDSIIEDNTGSIIYDALNAAQLNNEIVLLNNQYRNYKTQFYLNTSITETDFSVGYVNTTDPTQLDEFEEFEIYRFNTNVNYNMSTSDSVYEDYLIGSFVAGNFISTDTLNQSDGSSLSYLVSLDELEIYGSIYGNSGTYKYLTDSSVAAAYSANIANIDNLLKSTTGDGGDNIYVIPTDNQFFIERVNAIGAANTNDDNTIVTVADVKINSITYDGSVDTVDTDGDGDPDYDGLYKIDTITLDSTSPKISVNDCSVVTNGAACFIAPGNVASYNSNGIYTNYNALDVDGTNNNAPDPNSGNATGGATDGMDQGEYLGSAYVTSALAIITSAWKDDIDAGSVTMTNIVEKLVDTATLPANITGCIITVGGSTTGSVDCGSGMINLFAAVEASFVAYPTSLLPNHSAPVIYSTSSAFDYAYDLS